MIRSHRPRRRSARPGPTLRLTPPAWAKLLWLRDRGETEIGGFGLTSAHDLLRLEDLALVPQQTSLASVAFDDLAVAEFFEAQVDQGRRPGQFARIWIHTHPGDCPRPSVTDEATFARVFGHCDWAVMLIVARGGAVYARLEWHVGVTGAIDLPVAVDYGAPFAGSDVAAWQAEYDRCVRPRAGFAHWPFLESAEWSLPDDLRPDATAFSKLAGDGDEPSVSTPADLSRADLDHSGPELGVQRRVLVSGRDVPRRAGLFGPRGG